MSESTPTQTQMSAEEVLKAARQNVVDAPQPVANDNAAPAQSHAKEGGHAAKVSGMARTAPLTPQEALTNAGILYAKAAACFEGVYQEQVLERMAAQQR